MALLEASVESRATSDELARVVLSPEQLPKWFPMAKRAEADKGWPRVGTKIRWGGRGDKWPFEATLVQNRSGLEITMDVKTPSGTSKVIHRFDAIPGGLTRYVKQVLPEYQGWAKRLSFLTDKMITSSMQKEVRRVAALAEGRTPE